MNTTIKHTTGDIAQESPMIFPELTPGSSVMVNMASGRKNDEQPRYRMGVIVRTPDDPENVMENRYEVKFESDSPACKTKYFRAKQIKLHSDWVARVLAGTWAFTDTLRRDVIFAYRPLAVDPLAPPHVIVARCELVMPERSPSTWFVNARDGAALACVRVASWEAAKSLSPEQQILIAMPSASADVPAFAWGEGGAAHFASPGREHS